MIASLVAGKANLLFPDKIAGFSIAIFMEKVVDWPLQPLFLINRPEFRHKNGRKSEKSAILRPNPCKIREKTP